MTCTEFLAILDDLIDNSVAAQTRAEVESHLKKCGHCEVIFNTTRKTIEIYRDSKLYELPENLRTRLRTAIVAKCQSRKKSGSEGAPG